MAVVSAIAAAASVVSGAVSTFAATAVGSAVLQVAVGTGLNLVARAIAGKPKTPGEQQHRVTGRVQSGLVPRSIALGQCAANASLVWHTEYSRAEGNHYNGYVQVIALADAPVQGLRRVAINDEWVTLDTVPHADGRGVAVLDYRRDGEDYAWVRFYDGTQTTANPYLVNVVAPNSPREWESTRVGVGVAYLIVTARADPEFFPGFPSVRAELDGMALYDPSRDDTAGGDGDQRWNNPATWGGDGDYFPAVQVYNLLRGIRHGGQWLYGLQEAGIMPAAHWISMIQRCRTEIEHKDGMVPRWRTGGSVPVSAPAVDTINGILTSCAGRIAVDGNTFRAWIGGADSSPVAALHSDAVITDEPQRLTPIQRLGDRINGATGSYPSPAALWEYADLAPEYRTDLEAADGGRRLLASVTLDFCPHREQGQRVLKGAVKEAQKARRVALRVPSPYRDVAVGEVVTYTSERDGFDAKRFRLEGRYEHATGDLDWDMTEVDPSDYAWDSDTDFTDTTDGRTGRVDPIPQVVSDFAAIPWVIHDDHGPARPGIRLSWDQFVRDVSAVAYQVRLESTGELLPSGQATAGETSVATDALTFNGEPLTFNGEPLVFSVFSNVSAGFGIIAEGLTSNTLYEVRAWYIPTTARPVEKTEWMPVYSGNVKIREIDLEQQIREKIDEAFDTAKTVELQVIAADAKGSQALAELDALAGETLADLEDAIAALGGLDAAAIADARSTALRAMQTGWGVDPTLSIWDTGVPVHWTVTGFSGNAAQVAGFYGGGASIVAPAETGVTMRASSDVAEQLEAADPEAEWVVIHALVEMTSGDPAGVRFRAEWKADGASVWTRGIMRGEADALGSLADHGVTARPGVLQGIEVLVQRPAIGVDAEAVSVILTHPAEVLTPATYTVHLAGIRAASEAEIAAGQAAGDLAASVEALTLEIEGVADALALAQTTLTARIDNTDANLALNYLTSATTTAAIAAAETRLNTSIGATNAALQSNYYTKAQTDSALAGSEDLIRAEFEVADAQIANQVVAIASEIEALAGQSITFAATYNPDNLIRNAGWADGARPQGEKPNLWTSWGSTMSVVASGIGGVAQASAAAPYLMRIAQSPAEITARSAQIPAQEGDEFCVEFAHAMVGSGSSAGLVAEVRFRNAAGASLGNGGRRARVVSTATTWAVETQDAIMAPAGTAAAEGVLYREGAGIGDALVHSVRMWRVDPTVSARVDIAQAAAANAEQSVATLSQTVSASFGDVNSALASVTQTAQATAEKASSAVVLRAVAGAGGAGLRAVAWDDEDGAGGVLYLDGDAIIATGTLSAPLISVQELGANLVPDNQLQSPNAWSGSDGFELIRQTTRSDAASVGEIRFSGTEGTGWQQFTGLPFPTRPGRRHSCAAQTTMLSGTGTTMQVDCQIRWEDRDGDLIGSETFGSYTGNGGGLVDLDGEVIAPAGVAMGRFRWRVNANATDGAVRFFAPEVVRQYAGSTLITPNGITAREAFFEDLAALNIEVVRADIVDAAIGTLQIGGNAVTAGADAYAAGQREIAGGTTETVQSLVFSCDSGWRRLITCQVTPVFAASASSSFVIELRRRIGAGAWETLRSVGPAPYNSFAGTTLPIVFTVPDSALSAGSYRYELRIQTATGGDAVTVKDRSLIASIYKR